MASQFPGWFLLASSTECKKIMKSNMNPLTLQKLTDNAKFALVVATLGGLVHYFYTITCHVTDIERIY